MARKTWILVGLLTILSLLVGSFACTSSTTTTNPTTSSATTTTTAKPTTTAAPVKPIVLKMSSYQAANHMAQVNLLIPWMDAVEQKSGGRIKFERYFSQTLGKAADHAEMARTGIADVVTIVAGYTPGRFPLTSIVELPFAFTNATQAHQVSLQLGHQSWKEYADYKVLFMGMGGTTDFRTATKPIRTVADIKGMKIRTSGGYVTDALKALGAIPIEMPAVDIVTSMQRGVIEGVNYDAGSARSSNINTVTKYVTRVGLSTVASGWLMNKKAWDSLPPDLQKVVDEASLEFLAKKRGPVYDAVDKEALDLDIKEGIEIITLPQAEMDKIKAAVLPLWGSWVTDMNGLGLPGQATMDKFKSLLQTIK